MSHLKDLEDYERIGNVLYSWQLRGVSCQLSDVERELPDVREPAAELNRLAGSLAREAVRRELPASYIKALSDVSVNSYLYTDPDNRRAIALLKTMLLAEIPVNGAAVESNSTPADVETGNPVDTSAYVGATKLGDWRKRFKTYKLLKKFLDNNKAIIRQDSSQPNRLYVHAGDWTRYWNAKNEEEFDGLDIDSSAVSEAVKARPRTSRK